MAASKRKGARGTRKAGKKAMSRMSRKAPKAKKARKLMSSSTRKSSSVVKLIKIPPVTRVDKPFTKGKLISTLSGRTGFQKKEISEFFDELKSIIAVHINPKQGPGHITLPGLMKITVIHKPATKARRGRNPFTGEDMMFKAKPARNVVKVRALKQLKELV